MRGVAGERFAVRNSGARGGRRRRGRSRLRVHDRRPRRGARAHRAQLRRGHERRHRLRARRRRHLRAALQHRRWSISSRSWTTTKTRRRARTDRAACRAHRQRGRGPRAGRLGGDAAGRSSTVMPRDFKRVRDRGGARRAPQARQPGVRAIWWERDDGQGHRVRRVRSASSRRRGRSPSGCTTTVTSTPATPRTS